MRFNTAALFQLLLRKLQPELVCDVGSMDGYHSKRFRQLLPNARIVAFEANPHNLLRMRSDLELTNEGIEVIHKAVWNRTGTLDFFVQPTLENSPRWLAGVGSTRRTLNSQGVKPIELEAVRLDDFINELRPQPTSVALWIDVEGAAFEVLDGIRALRDCIAIVHVEVETREIWYGQRLKPAVQALMADLGFVELAHGSNEVQHDLVFVNGSMYAARRRRIRPLMALAFLVSIVQLAAGPIYRKARDLYFRAIPLSNRS